MRYKISHKNNYTYPKEIFLDSQVLKLFPESNIYQIVTNFNIEIDPEPYAMSRYVGAMENSVLQVWFDVLTNKFSVSTEFEVETLRKNSFGYITDPYSQKLKFNYASKLVPYLSLFMKPETQSELVKEFAEKIVKDAEYDTNMFLILLNKNINELCEYKKSALEPPKSSELTLIKQYGSCRDMAMLYIDTCRYIGIASRFVSGYFYNPNAEINYLHAWAEVYIPGGGWRGYDPTQGLAVGDKHIVLCSGVTPNDATPIPGYFRLDNKESILDFEIKIEVIDNKN